MTDKIIIPKLSDNRKVNATVQRSTIKVNDGGVNTIKTIHNTNILKVPAEPARIVSRLVQGPPGPKGDKGDPGDAVASQDLTFSYNDEDQITRLDEEDLTFKTFVYDSNGLLVSITDSVTEDKTLVYDSNGLLISLTNS